MKTETEKLEFHSSTGNSLSALLDRPAEGSPYAYVLFAHCFTCNKNYKGPVYIARKLAEMGIATLRFDFSGLGGSSGDFSQTSLSSNVEDVLSVVAHMNDEYKAPRALIGHSLGGAAVLLAASHVPSSELIVTIGTPARPGNLGYRLKLAKEQAEKEGVGILEVNNRQFKLRKEFFDDMAKQELEQSVRNLDRKLLVVHSPEDRTVPYTNAEELINWARLPKSLLSLDGADHLLSREEDAARVAQAIAVRLPK